MLNNNPVTELIDYKCADCGSNSWNIIIAQGVDGKTFLFTVCSNQECVEARREELQINNSQMVIWDEFDITGQTEHHIDSKDVN